MLFLYAVLLSAAAAAIACVTASAEEKKDKGDDNDPKNVVIIEKIAKAVHKVLLYSKSSLFSIHRRIRNFRLSVIILCTSFFCATKIGVPM